MGKKNNNSSSNKTQNPKEDILSTLEDFTSKENWDKFFTIRGSDDTFEWYAEWAQLEKTSPLLSLLQTNDNILIPGCGNSRLSEHLYDAGFKSITNIDFSKVVISDMLRRNVRDRPSMRWRVMDMTKMDDLGHGSFDVVLDKGGLDALLEPEFGPRLGAQYLSEVQRVLKFDGNFICLTLAESHVLGLLFPKFRVGWQMSIHCIPQKASTKPSLSTFMVVAVKKNSAMVEQIVTSFDPASVGCNHEQTRGLHAALEAENTIRKEYNDGSDIIYSLEDLKLGAKGDLMELMPGRRVQLTLGGQGDSVFRYRAVLLDAQSLSEPFMYHCGIFIVPKTRANEWLFSSDEGQWMVVESSKAARLVMVFLDSSHSISIDEIQKDLSPLVKQLAPEKHDTGSQIPFMMAGDGIKQRKVVHQVTSEFTGPIHVEDVVYEKVDDHVASNFPEKELVFRRLTFQRTESLVQSEALVMKESSPVHDDELGRETSVSNVKSKEKNKLKSKLSEESSIREQSRAVQIDHTILVSSYHRGMVAGLNLVSSYLERMVSCGKSVETVVIGLGAGLLPMFLHSCMDFLKLEVVELDPVVVKVAKEYFGFSEDERMKVHVADGIQFLKTLGNSKEMVDTNVEGDVVGNAAVASLNKKSATSSMRHQPGQKLDIIIVDVDSSDSGSGLSCPPAEFVEDLFLETVKEVLSEQGLFIINLVSRSPSMKNMVVSRIKAVFSHLFCLQLEEDVNELLFAVKSDECVMEENISQAAIKLQKLLKFQHPEGDQEIMKTVGKIKRLE